MKTKYFLLNNWFCTLFLLLFILLGCMEEDYFSLNEGNQRLSASIIEEDSNTRVILNDDTTNRKVEVCWTSGDAIGVFGTERGANIRYQTNENSISEDGKTAVFESNDSVPKGLLYAYYPYQEDATFSDWAIQLTMPATQMYVTDEAGTACPDPAANIMGGRGENENINFINLFSILRISIAGNKAQTVKKVLFTDLSGKPVSGKFSAAIPEVIFPETGSGKDLQIELDCKDGVALLFDTLTQFYLIVPARNYDKGFQIDFVLSDGEIITKTIGASGGKTLRRNRLYPIGDTTPKEKETTSDLGYKGFRSDAELFLEFVYSKESLILNALNYTSDGFTKAPFEGAISREKFELFFLELEEINKMAEQYEQAIDRLEESGVLQRPTQTRGLFTSTKDFLVWVSGSGKRNRERIHTVASNMNATERTKLYNGLRKDWKEKASSEADFWNKLENGDYDSSAGQMYNDFYHNVDTDFPFLAQDKGLTPHKIVVNEGAKGIEAGGNLALDAASAVAPGFGTGMTVVKVSDNVEKMVKSDSWKEAAEHGFNAAGDILEEITGDIGYTGFNGGDVVNIIRNKIHSSIFKQQDTNETKGKVTIEDGNRDKSASSIVIVEKEGGVQNIDGLPSIYITLKEMLSDGIEMLIEAGNWVMTIVNEKGYRETVEVTVEKGKAVVVNVDTESGKNEEYNKSKIITLTTSKSAGETISLECYGSGKIWIDLNNNGNLDEGERVTNYFDEVTYTLQSRIFSIYGDVETLSIAAGNKLTSIDASSHNTLTYLSCGVNELTQLNVSNCKELGALYCFKNQLTQLDVSSCTNLVYLSCLYNQLKTIDVSNCPKLFDLNCNYNQITSIDLRGNPNLDWLDIHHNQLTTLDVSGTNMSHLKCNNNQLTTLNVKGCTEMKELDCSDNQISSIDVSGFTKLQKLYCQNNHLTMLNVDGCIALQYLKCMSANNGLLGIVPDIFDNIRGTLEYQSRYLYEWDYDKDKTVVKEDRGVGFWYEHEPESGIHRREPR